MVIMILISPTIAEVYLWNTQLAMGSTQIFKQFNYLSCFELLLAISMLGASKLLYKRQAVADYPDTSHMSHVLLVKSIPC